MTLPLPQEPTIEALASQLRVLLDQNGDLLDSLDFVAGALVCLQETQSFRARTGATHAAYRATLSKRLVGISRGKKPKNPYWLAGLHFNSALMRIAAGYHRLLRALSGQARGEIRDLIPLLPAFENRCLEAIRREVNALKHDQDGLATGRSVSRATALFAIQELLDLTARVRNRNP